MDVSAERLQDYIDRLSHFGLNAQGGVDRAVYTPAWRAARDQLAEWIKGAGLQMWSDGVGNLFGRLEGSEGGAILTGSHLDTVPNGGKLDGALGVIAGLAVLESLAATRGKPRKSIELVALCEEEGSRFPANFWGSRAITGTVQSRELDALRDAQGVSIGQAMAELGLTGLESARRTDVESFLELHIEQGPVLELAGIQLGVVTSITGQYRASATVTGRPDHAGTTPMTARNDALVAAAEMALGIDAVARELGAPAVATVGRIEASPGAVNVVPGQVTFSLDARHPEALVFETLLGAIAERCGSIAIERGVELTWQGLMRVEPQPMDSGLCDVLETTAAELGYSTMRVHSGAGHDAQVMARAVPTSMLFVPSQQGRSHSPAEFTSVDQLVPGVRVLSRALERLAY